MNFFSLLEATRVRTQILRRGTVLYHGTSNDEDFDIPNGPAWFSRFESVANYFTHFRPGSRPRILTFKVITQIPRLLTITDKQDFEIALGEDYPDDQHEL